MDVGDKGVGHSSCCEAWEASQAEMEQGPKDMVRLCGFRTKEAGDRRQEL